MERTFSRRVKLRLVRCVCGALSFGNAGRAWPFSLCVALCVRFGVAVWMRPRASCAHGFNNIIVMYFR